MAPLDQTIADRISVIRYPMIYLIVVAHAPRAIAYVDDPTFLSFVSSFVTDGLIRLAIPTLTCISGFLVFHKSLDKRFLLLIRKRFLSLVVPLLIWNIPVALALYLIQWQGLIEHDWVVQRRMYPFELMTWLNAVFGITDYPINYPMHFLRDLFVLCAFAPLSGILLRKIPYIGLIALLVIFVPNLDGSLIRNDAMAITFYFGGMAAIRHWDVEKLDQHALSLVGLLIAICSIVVLTSAGRPAWLPLLAPFIVWPTSAFVLRTRIGHWFKQLSSTSVFLFLLHGLVLSMLSYAFPKVYDSRISFHTWLTIPFLVAIVCHAIYLLLGRFFPEFLIISTGWRKPSARSMGARGISIQ